MSNTTSQLLFQLGLQGDGQVRSGLKQVEGSITNMATAAKAAQDYLGPMLGTLTAGATLGKLVSVQREFDVLNSSLKTVTGSSAAAAKEMEWIKAFAKETPFGLAQATQAFVKMKSLGLDPSRAALTSYGNTASAMGKDLNQMIEAVADASTGEFERLKEFGIKASKEGDRVKLTFQGVSQTIGNNAGEINAYLQSIGDNQFAGAMAERAATLDGAIASLGDTWDELFRTISAQNAGTLMQDSVRLAEGAVTDLTTIIQALNGATSDNAQQTGAMAVVQDGLATAFEAVVVLGVNVKYTLVQIGNELGGLAAQAAAVATGQFAQAAEIGRLMRSDAVAARAEVDATSARILSARKVAALGLPNNYDEPAVIRARAAAVAAEAKAKKDAADAAAKKSAAETAAAAAAKQAASDAKKELAQFNTALESVREKASGLSSTYTETLSALYNGYQKNRIGADDYRTAVEALIQQQPFFVEAEKAKAASIAEAEKLLATARAGSLKLSEAAEEAQAASADQLADRLASMRDEIALIGLTAQQVAELTAAKAEQVIADKEIELIMLRNADASAAQISALEREINLRRQLVGAMRDKTVKEAAAESADQAQKEWKKASEQIEQSLTDALMRGFEGGKGFAENLRDTVENMFKTLVLRPIVSAVVSPVAGAITAGLGLPGAASAQGGNLLGGMVNNYASGAIGAGLWGSSAAYGAALGTTSIGAGSQAAMLAAQTGAFGSAGTAATAAAAGNAGMSAVMTAAPYLGAALAVAAIISSLDDSGTMHTGGIGGYSAAGGTATGAAAGLRFGVDAKDYTASAATASAQIAQSIVGMLDSTATTFGQKAGYYAATAFADDTSKDGAWGALMIKMGDKLVLDWASNPALDANVPRVFSDGEAGAKEYAAAVAKDVRDYLITQTPAWADTMLTALGDAPSLEQLAATVGHINATATALEGMGRASQEFANLAESATNTLIAALGGGEAAVANLSSYYANYYSEAARAEIATRQLTEQLATLGVALPETRDAYRDLVDNALASGNQRLAADLIKLSGAYAAVSKSSDELATAQAAQAAQADQAAQDVVKASEDLRSAFAGLLQPLLDAVASARQQVTADMGVLAGLPGPTLAQLRDQVAAQQVTLPSSAGVVSSKAATDAAYLRLYDVDTAVSVYQRQSDSANAALKTASGQSVTEAAVNAALKAALLSGMKDIRVQAQAAVNAATAAQAKAQADYATALRGYVADASKAVDKLGDLREKTVAYYEAQKQLSDGMLASSQQLRTAAQTMRYGQLSAGQTLALQQSEFSQAYSLALSTTGTVQAGYADKLSALLPGLNDAVRDRSSNRTEWAVATAKLFAQSQRVADSLAANAPKDYQAESLSVLGQIDGTLAAIESATSSAEKIISDAIFVSGGQTLAGLRGVIAAIKGETVPAFAAGGYHAGGVRLVGEGGPELELTGPARIFNASQTQAMLRGSGGESGSAAVVAELRELRTELQNLRAETRATAINTGRLEQLTKRVTRNGEAMQTQAVPA